MVKPNHLKTLLACAAMTFATSFSQTSFAQDISDSHLKAAKDAISALRVTRSFDQILPSASEGLKIAIIQANPNFSDEISLTVDNEALKLAPRRADLENEAGLIYAKRFSEEELLTIAEFYGSDLGQKLLTEQPSVGRELVRAAEIWTSGITRDLRTAANSALAESLSSSAPDNN